MTNEEQIALLRAAKERLFSKGWVQGGIGGINGPNCLVGAVKYSANNGIFRQSYLAIERVLDDCFKGKGYLAPAAVFNDNPATTFDDVIDVIDRAIKKLEAF